MPTIESDYRPPYSVDVSRPAEFEKYDTVIATDMEGPHVIGDTALDVMSAYVRREDASSKIDYGGILYGETYEWFEDTFDRRGFGQEGSDIILAMPALLYVGVSESIIREQAAQSRRTPGSDAYITYLKNHGARVVGVTTAWDCAINEIATKKVGLDGVVSTQFPIDQIREQLQLGTVWDEEMERVEAFLEDSFDIIEELATSDLQSDVKHRLRERIHSFYTGELGLFWERSGDMVATKRTNTMAVLLTQLDVVGDKRKALAAQQIFTESGKNDALHIAIGDGLNDTHMLSSAPWSIGVNGADAATAAKIGVVTPDMRALITITEHIKRYPEPTPENLSRVVEESQAILGESALVHLGAGQQIPMEILTLHKNMKKEIRGRGALLP